MTSRSKFVEHNNYVVTRKEMIEWPCDVVQKANYLVHAYSLRDPLILVDEKRGGFGLFATRDYAKGEFVTEYGGVVLSSSDSQRQNNNSDYVGYLGNGICIDGHHGFRLCQRGRWINEYDGQRSVVNVKLGRNVRTTCPVKSGEQFFGDYGPEYQRSY